MTDESHLLVEHRGGIGLITLNRPEALNALSLGMIRGIREILAVWRDDPEIRAIIFRGAGDRAFCAGGDVKKVYDAGIGIADPTLKTALARVYFAAEYRMNREMFHYPKPLIAFMNGITMGGGFGVAGACSVRIATEHTRFAMPEVGIGFFPDVGSVYHLTRAGRMGDWLALTGNSIGAADMCALGLANAFIPEGRFAETLERVIEIGDVTLFEQASTKPDPSSAILENQKKEIENTFSFNRVEGIFQALDKCQNEFAVKTKQTILTRSPTSLKLTLAYLRRMEGAAFDSVTAMDYRLAIRCMQGHEFYEGIRAALIDRDKQPKWNPGKLEDVHNDVIENYFTDDLPDLDHAPE